MVDRSILQTKSERHYSLLFLSKASYSFLARQNLFVTEQNPLNQMAYVFCSRSTVEFRQGSVSVGASEEPEAAAFSWFVSPGNQRSPRAAGRSRYVPAMSRSVRLVTGDEL